MKISAEDAVKSLEGLGCNVERYEVDGEVLFDVTTKAGVQKGPMNEPELGWFYKGYTDGR